MVAIVKISKLSEAIEFARMNEQIWGSPVSEDIIEYFKKGMSFFPRGYLLAKENSHIVGSSEGFPIKKILPISVLNKFEDPVDLYDPYGCYYYIHTVQVITPFRCRGIGEALLNSQISVARACGINTVCGIAIENQLQHWLNSGFKAVGDWGKYKSYGLFRWVEMTV